MTAFDHRRIGVVLLAAVLAVAGGCGGSDSKKQAQDKAAQKKARAAAAAQRSDGDRYASAVYLAKGLRRSSCATTCCRSRSPVHHSRSNSRSRPAMAASGSNSK